MIVRSLSTSVPAVPMERLFQLAEHLVGVKKDYCISEKEDDEFGLRKLAKYLDEKLPSKKEEESLKQGIDGEEYVCPAALDQK